MSTEDPIKRKVEFDVFVWVISILSSVMLMLSGYLFTETSSLRTVLAETNGRSDALAKELAARLDAEKEKNTGVLVTLAEIKGDLRNIRERLERPAAR